MKLRLSILYSWFVKTVTYFFPNHPVFMRFRGWLYSLMMKSCGNDFQVASTATINSLSELEVGSNVYIAHNTVIIGTEIKIGDKVIIGPNCIISSGNHVFENNSFRFGKSLSKGVIVGEGSWIAGNSSILGGASLPRYSILAAGAVLTKSMQEEKTIYAGVPAVMIGRVQ